MKSSLTFIPFVSFKSHTCSDPTPPLSSTLFVNPGPNAPADLASDVATEPGPYTSAIGPAHAAAVGAADAPTLAPPYPSTLSVAHPPAHGVAHTPAVGAADAPAVAGRCRTEYHNSVHSP